MASTEDIENLRLLINEPGVEEPYTAIKLSALIDASPSLPAAAAEVWRRKAGTYAELVNMSENGSSRSNSELYKQALAMAALYQAQADAAVTPVVVNDGLSRTRKIVRG